MARVTRHVFETDELNSVVRRIHEGKDVDVGRNLSVPGYRIERELGRGGIATVYLACQESLDRHVALKVMAPALVSEPTFAERFLREGQTIARLNHPGIVTIYDIEVADFLPYIAMEYLSGGSLKEKMRARISHSTTLAVIGQIAAALSYAHQQGIVHRDVKPENILFRGQKSAVLTDFGIAKTAARDPHLTTAGIVVGTPRYMSPEQADGRGADHRTDIYALGVILYELLTGNPPYDGKDSIGLLYAHINEPIPRLSQELSRFQPLVDSMMAKDPDQRAGDCAEVLAIIRETREGGSTHSARATPAGRQSPHAGASWRQPGVGARALPVLIGVSLAVILMVGAWYASGKHADPVGGSDSTATAGAAVVSDHTAAAVAHSVSPGTAHRLSPTPPANTAAATGKPGSPAAVLERGVRAQPANDAVPAAQARVLAEHIESLLMLADKQIQVGQLSTPAGDNAVDTYRSILEQVPVHTEASAGLLRVANEYLRRARTAITRKDYTLAESNIRSGLDVVPHHQTLNSLRTRIERTVEAQQAYAAGVKHKTGEGVPRNMTRAMRNFSRAAVLGHAQAQYQLGLAYANGVGAVRDEEQALRWLRHAAKQGHAEARYNLGLGLLFGPSPDPANAARWMQRLGEEEYKPAYRVLGWMYGTGTGTELSIQKSLKWYFKRKLKNMFGEPALPRHVIPLWQERFESALSESTGGDEPTFLQPG